MNFDKRKYYFDKEAAERPVRFIETYVCHVDGDKAGEPFLLDPFQKDFLRNVFGWKFKSDGRRKHKYFWLEIPKGNGKSMLLSAISIYMACADEFLPTRGELYMAAGDRDQARIVFEGAKHMIEESPKLEPFFEVFRNSIIHKKSKCALKALSSETATKHGYRPWLISFDEIHVQKNRELWDTLTKGLIKSPNSMCGVITTAGVKNTFGEEMHRMASQIERGIINNPHWYVKIYSAYDDGTEDFDEEDAYKVDTVALANPGYGTIIKPEEFEVEIANTKSQKTGFNSYLRLHLNVWTGSTEKWKAAKVFDKCNSGPVDIEYLKTLPCYGGYDGAHTGDLSSFSLIFEKPDLSLIWLPFFWCPLDTIHERTLHENVNYEQWVKEGHIIATTGNVQDSDLIRDKIIELCKTFQVQSIGYDSAYAKVIMAQVYGSTDIQVNAVSQTVYGLTRATKEMEKRLMAGAKLHDLKANNGDSDEVEKMISQSINHMGNPILRWQIDNVELYRDTNDNIRPHKGKSRDRIDGIAAGVNALDQLLMSKGDDSGPSKYEDEGITVV